MNFPLVSIIVPVYKVEPYLRCCLDSILSQTYTNWECILVDDGSPDGCGTICDEYAAMDERYKVIHQANLGVTRARANGVSLASGEFVTFVDSDDSIRPDAVAALLERMSPDVDISICMNTCIELSQQLLTKHEFMIKLLAGECGYVTPWAKLYRAALFTSKIFDISPDLKNGEDRIMNLRLVSNTKQKIVVFSSDIYNYRVRTDGATGSLIWSLDYVSLVIRETRKSISGLMDAGIYWSVFKRAIAVMYVVLLRLNKKNYVELCRILVSVLKYCPLETIDYVYVTTNSVKIKRILRFFRIKQVFEACDKF